MDKQAKSHLSRDKVLKKLIAKFEIKQYWGHQSNHFLDLVEIITGQQLSMKAADTIFKRFLALFSTKPKPEDILKIPIDKLRSIGLSNSKSRYVHNIASAIVDSSLPLDRLDKMTGDEVKKELIKIKGIGPWSAEMFLMFSLKRPDVFSVGDLGLRTAIEKLYGIKRDNLKQIEKLAETWRPHRTLACRLLWSSQ